MRTRTVLGFLSVPFGITVFILLTVCLSPIRWDKKSFGPVLPQLESKSLSSVGNFLFVSTDNSWESGHYAQYGFDMLTFPNGNLQWMIFKEGDQGGYSWRPNWSIDNLGNIYRYGTEGTQTTTHQIPDDLGLFLKSASVVVANTETRDRLLSRWSSISASNISVMRKGEESFVERPRVRVTLNQCIRVFLLSLILVGGIAVAAAWGGANTSGALKLTNLAIALPSLLVFHTLLTFLLGTITAKSISTAVTVESVVAVCIISYFAVKGRLSDQFSDLRQTITSFGRGKISLVVTGALIFLMFSSLRLDFDGDMLTQYLPVARYHYLLGRHDARALTSRYGVMTQATYPPGFPILLSTLMWAANTDAQSPVQFNYSTNLMVYLYRLLLSVLHLSFLIALASVFKVFTFGGRGLSWLLPPIAVALILPVFLGQPAAAEVYLVPVVGFALIALLASSWFPNGFFTQIGLFIGSSGLFIKKEGLPILCLILFTWYLATLETKRFSLRNSLGHVGAVTLGLFPFLVWRISLGDLAANEFFFYSRSSLSSFGASLGLASKIVEKAIKIVLANNYWVALILLLPLTVVFISAFRSWRDQIIPLGIGVYIAAMTGVYIVSNHPAGPIEHMNTSYDRVVMVAVLASIICAGRVFLLSKAEETNQQTPDDRPSIHVERNLYEITVR